MSENSNKGSGGVWVVSLVILAIAWNASSDDDSEEVPDSSEHAISDYDWPEEDEEDLPDLDLEAFADAGEAVPSTSFDKFEGYIGSIESESSSPPSYQYAYPTIPSMEDETEERHFDERAARRQAERKMARRGYDYSFGCTIDCSGHEAGWQYRADTKYPTYGSLNYGKSQSFAEGAQAFENAVTKEVERSRQDFNFGSDEYATDYPNF